MTRRRIVYPLFLIVLASLVLLPDVHAGTNIVFISTTAIVDSPGTGTTTTASFTSTSGDTIFVVIVGTGSFNGFGYSDSLGNTYTQKVSSVTSNGAGLSTYIATATVVNAGSETVSVTAPAARIYSILAMEYRNVAGYGVTATSQNDAVTTGAQTFTSSLTFSNTQGIGGMIFEMNYFVCGVSQTIPPTMNNAQVIRQVRGNPNSPDVVDEYPIAVNSFTISDTWTFAGACSGGFDSHIGIELLGSSTSTISQVTQCYGNCGTPPITLVNTNSTHTINFNSSLTVFYEFQSAITGTVQNITTNLAKTYTNGQQVSLSIYTASCNSGIAPFTASCPGQQQILSTFTNPVKGRLSVSTSSIQVQVNLWVAVAISAVIGGLDINDTNLLVPVFQQNPAMPPILASAQANGNSKMALWAYVKGSLGGPPATILQPSCGGDMICILTQSIIVLTPNNLLVGALFMGFAYSIVSTIGLAWFSGRFRISLPGGVYILIWVGWFTLFASLVGQIFFVVLEILAVTLFFAAFGGSLLKGGIVNSGRETA